MKNKYFIYPIFVFILIFIHLDFALCQDTSQAFNRIANDIDTIKTLIRKTIVDSSKTLANTSSKTQANTDTASIVRLRTANDLKTGNLQDVFASFFQLAATDLAGKNKSFDFKSTLFALRVKTDPALNIDTNYVRHSFDRNFQFNVSLRLDSQFKFNGFSGGFTWAAVNKRDSTVLSFIGSEDDLRFKKSTKLLSDLEENYFYPLRNHNPNDAGYGRFIKVSDSILYSKVYRITKKITSSRGIIVLDSFPEPFKSYLIPDSAGLAGYNILKYAFDKALAEVATKPLLTFSLNSAFNKQSGFDSAQFGFVYLQGLVKKKKNIELDLRGNISSKDTLINQDHYRTLWNIKGGLNFSLLSNNKTQASIFEFKPYLEYDNVLTGLLPGEARNMFLCNAELRLRITNNLWLPLTIKYDTQKGNFLGFLNISLNMNAFKVSAKS